MLRPVMPTCRERGAQPLSVTFRVAANSASRSAANGESSAYSSGWTAAPTPMTISARANTSTSSSRRRDTSANSTARFHRPDRHHGGVRAARRHRQDPGAHRHHPDMGGAGDVRHQRSRERRLGCDQVTIGNLEPDGISDQSRAEGSRHPSENLAPECRAGPEDSPKRLFGRPFHYGSGGVLGDVGADEMGDLVRPRSSPSDAIAPSSKDSACTRAPMAPARTEAAPSSSAPTCGRPASMMTAMTRSG